MIHAVLVYTTMIHASLQPMVHYESPMETKCKRKQFSAAHILLETSGYFQWNRCMHDAGSVRSSPSQGAARLINSFVNEYTYSAPSTVPQGNRGIPHTLETLITSGSCMYMTPYFLKVSLNTSCSTKRFVFLIVICTNDFSV